MKPKVVHYFFYIALFIFSCSNDDNFEDANSYKIKHSLEKEKSIKETDIKIYFDTTTAEVVGIVGNDIIVIGKHYGTFGAHPKIDLFNHNKKKYVLITEYITSLGITSDNIYLYRIDETAKRINRVLEKQMIGEHNVELDTLSNILFYETTFSMDTFKIVSFIPFKSVDLKNKFTDSIIYEKYIGN